MSRTETLIKDLLPHRNRMLLINEVVHVDEKGGIFQARVNDQWPLFDGRGVNPMVLIELAAQSGGICIGWNIQNRHEEMPSSGWLVGIKQSRFWVDILPVGAEIETRMTLGHSYDILRELFGTAYVGSEIVGEMTLQVILVE